MGFFSEIKKVVKGVGKAPLDFAANPKDGFSADGLEKHASGMLHGIDVSDKYKNGVLRPPEESSTDPTKSGSASDRMGQLIRAEWDDYVTRFQPYDQRVISMATGDEDNLAAVGRARAGVAGSFDVAQGTLQRNKERLGLSDAADEIAVQNRNTTTARTSSELNAINGTRIHAQDRDLSLMAGDAAAGLKSGRLSGA